MAIFRPQRIRDPIHNLIEFGKNQFEQVLWNVIQTRPFQRLRRIKQLGFSDLVYPGATHTRFAHSVGVFHTARQLMQIIRHNIGDRVFEDSRANVALAAALVHDLGHGMFSHAFEDVGKALKLKMAHHEHVSDQLIRDSEVSEVLKKLGSGFANDVADVIKRGRPGDFYDAVVSSQFDADRLDYMQRDRLMTGVQNSGIDFTWLINNLEIGTVNIGVDDQPLIQPVETFVLGPKAIHAAETYVLSLFQLYPTVYFHKATRAAEKVFSALMQRVVALVRENNIDKTGLPTTHPIVVFARDSDSVENALALDDTVFLGGLSLMSSAADQCVAICANRLYERRLPKCIDIRARLEAACALQPPANPAENTKDKLIERKITRIRERLEAWSKENTAEAPRMFIDYSVRDPYKRFQESKGPLNQIRIRSTDGRILDMAESSPVVSGIKTFHLFRVYIDGGDTDARSVIESAVQEALRSDGDA